MFPSTINALMRQQIIYMFPRFCLDSHAASVHQITKNNIQVSQRKVSSSMRKPQSSTAIPNNSKTQALLHVKIKRQSFQAFKFWKKKQDLDEVVGKHCGINLIYSSFYRGFKDARPSERNTSATPQFIRKDSTAARVIVILDR